MYCVVIGSLSHLVWSYIFVTHLQLKIVGTAIAVFLTSLQIFVSTLIVSNRQADLKQAMDVKMSDPRVFKLLGEYWGMGFPSMMVVFLDWSAAEILVILSGYFGV